MNDSENASHCGFVAIVGRPNVGKSTLLNHVLGQKLSITSRKPQTTRHQILGIKTEGRVQTIFVDTPGLHLKEANAMNRYMNRAASAGMSGVDVIVFVIDRTQWTDDDDLVLSRVANADCPVILAINKVDRLHDKANLLPHMEMLASKHAFAAVVPISAERGDNVDGLEKEIAKYLPEGIHHYPDDQITDRSQRFLAAELVREKVMRQLGDELPYAVAVEIEQFKQEGKILHISALLLVEREGQKKILIGEKGERLKVIGRDARKDMQKMFESKVMLTLWVKVKRGWSDDERVLKSLGFNDV